MAAFDRERDRLMLRTVENDLRQCYYDSTFHGLALKTVFDSAEARIALAESHSEAFLTIALALHALHDSHTRFYPPKRVADVRYGWNLGMVGDSCYILRVAREATRPSRESSAVIV